MIRLFKPAEGFTRVEFAAAGQSDLVVVPVEGLEVNDEENLDLAYALVAHQHVVEDESAAYEPLPTVDEPAPDEPAVSDEAPVEPDPED